MVHDAAMSWTPLKHLSFIVSHVLLFYTYIELILIFCYVKLILFYFYISEMMLVAKLANKIPSI